MLKRLAFARPFLLAAAAFAAVLAADPASAADKTIKLGVTGGPHAEIMEVVKAEAARHGLDIDIIEFQDYIQPNAALAEGDLDANSYQTYPFLEQQVADRGYKITAVAETVVFPMGLYSHKIKSVADLAPGAQIGIPNDPVNQGRGLQLLEHAGIIKLRPGLGFKATPADVVENPKGVKIVPLEAAQLPRALDDLDAAAINTNFALSGGLDPARDTIAREDFTRKNVNLVAVQTKDKDADWVKTLVAAYHSQPVKSFIEGKYAGAVVAGW